MFTENQNVDQKKEGIMIYGKTLRLREYSKNDVLITCTFLGLISVYIYETYTKCF